MTNKKFGRVGDSPIIGAGCFAEDASCAVSATGHGEYYIRHVVAYDIAARVKYKGNTVREAADAVIHGVLTPEAGEGRRHRPRHEGPLVHPLQLGGDVSRHDHRGRQGPHRDLRGQGTLSRPPP